jgi:hypothetical protein
MNDEARGISDADDNPDHGHHWEKRAFKKVLSNDSIPPWYGMDLDKGHRLVWVPEATPVTAHAVARALRTP